MLHSHEPDRCCAKALSKALETGTLDDKTVWTHERCGQEWRAVTVSHYGETVRHWAPHVYIEVW